MDFYTVTHIQDGRVISCHSFDELSEAYIFVDSLIDIYSGPAFRAHQHLYKIIEEFSGVSVAEINQEGD